MCFFPTLKISLSSSLSSLSSTHTCHTNISPLSTYILLTPISVSCKSNSSLFLSIIHIFSQDYTQTQMHPLTGFHRYYICLFQFCSVQSCPTLCDPMEGSTPGPPVHHHLPELTQTHVRWVGDAIQPSHHTYKYIYHLLNFLPIHRFLFSFPSQQRSQNTKE